jgi:hypothetical protein
VEVLSPGSGGPDRAGHLGRQAEDGPTRRNVHRIVDGPLDGDEDVDEGGERGAHRGEFALRELFVWQVCGCNEGGRKDEKYVPGQKYSVVYPLGP